MLETRFGTIELKKSATDTLLCRVTGLLPFLKSEVTGVAGYNILSYLFFVIFFTGGGCWSLLSMFGGWGGRFSLRSKQRVI